MDDQHPAIPDTLPNKHGLIVFPMEARVGAPATKTWTETVASSETKKMAATADAFFAKSGHWNQLVSTAEKLRKEVAALYHSTEYPTQPHRDDLGDAYRHYLFGDLGIHGELTNPLAAIVTFKFAPNAPFANDSLPIRLAAFCRGFEEHSELSKAPAPIATKTNAITHGFDERGNEIPYPEPKRVALFRAADVIEQWLEHNRNHISFKKQEAIEKHLATYRNELAHTLGFVNEAKEFLAQQQRAGLRDNLNSDYVGR